MRYRKLSDGEEASFGPNERGHILAKIACCDCGLVHIVLFKPGRRRLRTFWWRDRRATANKRRRRRTP